MIRVYNDFEALSHAAAELFTVQSRQASLICGRFSVALSGGETLRRLYELLGTSPVSRSHPLERGACILER